MKRYDVHIYPVVRVKVSGVEAESQVEAIRKAEEMTDFHRLFDREANGIEYAEDIDCFLADEDGDEEYLNSRWYDKEYRPL